MPARDPSSQLSQQEIEAIKVTQDIIKRMSDNSQKMKNIFLGASAVFYALIGKGLAYSGCKVFLAYAIISIMFWFLDSRYLLLERKFRDHNIAIVLGSIPSLEVWGFNPHKYQRESIWKTMFSFSEIIYPIMIFVMCLFIYL